MTKSERYEVDPEFRAKVKEYNARYYQKNKSWLRDRAVRNKRGRKKMTLGTIVTINGKEYEVFQIGVLARNLGRSTQTVRKWERDGIIPIALRDPTGRRVYLKEHIDAIVRCANECKLRPGDSLRESGFPEKVEEAFEHIRKTLID